MNDTAREYLSYGKFLIPLLKVRKTIRPVEIKWGGKDQYVHYFRGAEPRKDKVVIYIHGGGWNSRNPKQDFYIGQNIASQGYDCFMPCYRKTPKFRYDDIVDDVFKGYRAIEEYMRENDLDYAKKIVMGSSAGAHLGAVLCFDEALRERYKIGHVEALLTMAGPLRFDLPNTGTLNLLLKSLFDSKDPAVWAKGEPYRMITPHEDFKLFMIQSKHDGLVGWDQAVSFKDRAVENGIPSEIYEVTESWNTHSAYCAGVFLKNVGESATLDMVYEMLGKV